MADTGGKLAFKGTNGGVFAYGRAGALGNVKNELKSFGLAEVVSEGVWLGLVAIEDKLIPPKLLKHASQAVGKFLVEPYLLDMLEGFLGKACRLEECKIDMSKPREERAEDMAKMMLLYIPAATIAWEAKIRARRFFNQSMHVDAEHNTKVPADASVLKKLSYWIPGVQWSPQERMIAIADEGMHLGSMYVMNNQMAPCTDQMIRSTSSMIEKISGATPKKAHELATAAWVWAVPNVIGAMGGSLAIAGKHLGDWPTGFVGKLLGRKGGSYAEKLALQGEVAGHSL